MTHPKSPEISVVVPVYGSDDVLRELYRRVIATVEKITAEFELILVNDASPDNAWQVIREDQPEEIARMYEKAQEGFFVVVGSRQKRHDSMFRSFFSRAFYAALSYLSGTYQDPSVANFGIYHRKVIDAVLSLEDHMRYFSVMVRWVGFRTAKVPVQHAERKGGKSGYSLRKLFSLAIDIILTYSEKPLRFIVKVGAVVVLCAGLYLAIVLFQGFASGSLDLMRVRFLIGSVWLIFGLLVVMLGIIALYLGKTFEEVKKRPIYIVQEEI